MSNISRREFLRAGSLGFVAAAIPEWPAMLAAPPMRASADHCIMLMLAGGPSQIDTWDMKPDAIANVRGPLRPIGTKVAGIRISEIFPRMARQADKYALLRSVHSRSKPLHDLARREMETGHVSSGVFEYPCCGAVVAGLRPTQKAVAGHVLLSNSARHSKTDVRAEAAASWFGKKYASATLGTTPENFELGDLAEAFDVHREPPWICESYGHHDFGRSCLTARRLIERGVRFVTVDVFDPAIGRNAWDIHGSRPFPGIAGYRDEVGPKFDRAYSALLEDLHSRGLLTKVLVVAVGEFGRTPRINSNGGRDHWTGCWTAVFAGGGVRGGQVVGASDAIGSEPCDRPVTPAQIVATVYHSLGISLDSRIRGPQGEAMRVVESGAEPILELF